MRKHVDKGLATKLRNINPLMGVEEQLYADQETGETPRRQAAQENSNQASDETRRESSGASGEEAGKYRDGNPRPS